MLGRPQGFKGRDLIGYDTPDQANVLRGELQDPVVCYTISIPYRPGFHSLQALPILLTELAATRPSKHYK